MKNFKNNNKSKGPKLKNRRKLKLNIKDEIYKLYIDYIFKVFFSLV